MLHESKIKEKLQMLHNQKYNLEVEMSNVVADYDGEEIQERININKVTIETLEWVLEVKKYGY